MKKSEWDALPLEVRYKVHIALYERFTLVLFGVIVILATAFIISLIK